MSDSTQYLLQWRGCKKGPLDLPAIHEALESGDIHSMHQIEVEGEWQTLRDFLEAEYLREKATTRESSKISKWTGPQHRDDGRKPIPVPLRGRARQREDTPDHQTPLRSQHRSSSLPTVDDTTHSSPKYEGQSENSSQSKPPDEAGAHSLEWRHVGMALLLLLSIVVAAFGSFAIVKVLTTPAVEGRSSSMR